MRESVGVGFQHQAAQQRRAHDAETARGLAVEALRGALAEREGFLERAEVAGVGGGKGAFLRGKSRF